ncbi:hypothetical protein BX661DRAFT_19009 [Kickxella alabastrina]|uniref:uncharacterized protein n=1 Tax=Kickxella alabastrina TaxID=61397 RepID=UPI00222050A7|nr:uncharacterized protein BX661DRAFT_19009 [Kickxella alabastrina]KAI7827922.1 hypothetical protein BX661DRAFT_19009 [Kickxella alabastrina]
MLNNLFGSNLILNVFVNDKIQGNRAKQASVSVNKIIDKQHDWYKKQCDLQIEQEMRGSLTPEKHRLLMRTPISTNNPEYQICDKMKMTACQSGHGQTKMRTADMHTTYLAMVDTLAGRLSPQI